MPTPAKCTVLSRSAPSRQGGGSKPTGRHVSIANGRPADRLCSLGGGRRTWRYERLQRSVPEGSLQYRRVGARLSRAFASLAAGQTRLQSRRAGHQGRIFMHRRSYTNVLICRDERDCGRGFLSGVVWPAPGAAGAGSAPDVSPCFLCVVWLVRVRRAAWFLRVLQEMLVMRDIPEVPGRLMGDGRAVCP
jgi:hypothetical protein